MILFDTETTGLLQPEAAPLSSQPKIIEFAAIKLSDVHPHPEIGRIEFFANPGEALSAKIIQVTGIKDSMLEGEASFGAKLGDLIDFFLGERYLIAHNLSFDLGMLSNELRRLNRLNKFPWPPQQICTIEASYEIRGRRLKLGDLHTIVTGAPHADAHRAMNDVEALVTCTRWLIDQDMITIKAPGAIQGMSLDGNPAVLLAHLTGSPVDQKMKDYCDEAVPDTTVKIGKGAPKAKPAAKPKRATK